MSPAAAFALSEEPPVEASESSPDPSLRRLELPNPLASARAAVTKVASAVTGFGGRTATAISRLGAWFWRLAGRLWSWSRARLKAAGILLGVVLWRLATLFAVLVRTSAVYLLAALTRMVRWARVEAPRFWRRLWPPSEGVPEPNHSAAAVPREDSTVVPSGADAPAEALVVARPGRQPELIHELTQRAEPATVADAGPAAGNGGAAPAPQLGTSDQVLEALLSLGQRGVAVTSVLRDQGGVRVRGVLNGRPTTSWYSFDECARLIELNAAAAVPSEEVAAEPEPAPAPPKRGAWPTIALFGGLLMAAVTLVATSLPESWRLAANWGDRLGALAADLLR